MKASRNERPAVASLHRRGYSFNMSRHTRSTLLLIGALIIIGVFLVANRDALQSATPTLQSYECDADARICPDGSIVGRTGEHCEFSECPGVIPTSSDTIYGVAVLRGVVVISSTCEIETVPPDPFCSPKTHQTDVLAIDPASGIATANTRAALNGEYVLDLPPGTYIIRAVGGDNIRCEDFEIALEEGERRSLNISCDQGKKD
jgi:hypothetical protein